MNIYDYSVPRPDGSELKLSEYKGRVMIIVNTATGCGFTPHYEPLEKMYEAYHEKGLEIIDIPCNQFAGQTPGTDEEIHRFCTLKYNTKFPQMKKSDVNGENALPLYGYLKSQQGFEGFGNLLLCLVFFLCQHFVIDAHYVQQAGCYLALLHVLRLIVNTWATTPANQQQHGNVIHFLVGE
jgi:glutathione peroxidase-family protein